MLLCITRDISVNESSVESIINKHGEDGKVQSIITLRSGRVILPKPGKDWNDIWRKAKSIRCNWTNGVVYE